jgi:hypothetical protein
VFSRSPSASIAHGGQHIQDQVLKERGAPFPYTIQYLSGNGCVRLRYRGGDRLPGSRFIRAWRWFGVADLPRAASELEELLELDKDAEVYAIRVFCQDFVPARRDLYDSAPGSANQSALVQVRDGPMQAAREQRSATWDGGGQIVISQSDLISDHGP